ncbi:proteinaceous RNase P 2 [Iris pallida]|uniref:ribonuclease P n=1 Tax=Iris pallida TaxID=29817 RepID=A0AAX6IM09_IRIPA|nr:proteinaceous RNase P 2 [Iris pallida]
MATEPPQNPNPNPKKKKKQNNQGSQFRFNLDRCSKNNDLHGALSLYESALVDGITLSSYHFSALLHLLSNSLQTLTLDSDSTRSTIDSSFQIYNRMLSLGVAPTESTITSMARIASHQPGGGEVAFDLVKDVKEKYGLVPKLRTFGPALFAFCRESKADRAYEVEREMISLKISLEEPEIAALFEVSAKNGNGEKVYEYLLKLRNVGCVGASTAAVLKGWFGGEFAAGFGRRDWDVGMVKNAILTNGGGWHGMGWLREGKWDVRQGGVSADGLCSCCGQRLACVDIERKEAEMFAESVAGLALEREARSNFRNFQDWLEKHAQYEAVIDAANIALYQQNYADGGFSLSQIDAVVRELSTISQGKWPLVILHNKRYRTLMENPSNKQLLETWRAKGALYTTPNGSNDDWYWLFAAVKLNCLLVTNDEMRDHIFELLGRSFFPKWKERHQVRYTFVKGVLRLVMPPPYSVVIQESEIGSWHVPLDDKLGDERSRIWVCITRPESCKSLSEADGGDNLIHTTQVQTQADATSSHLGNGTAKQATGKRKERDFHSLKEFC